MYALMFLKAQQTFKKMPVFIRAHSIIHTESVRSHIFARVVSMPLLAAICRDLLVGSKSVSIGPLPSRSVVKLGAKKHVIDKVTCSVREQKQPARERMREERRRGRERERERGRERESERGGARESATEVV